MHVDLTDAAKAYGLTFVPPITAASETPTAAWDPDTQAMELNPAFWDQSLTDDYSQSRFKRAGAPKLDYEDAHRFVLAHELWHARQDQDDPEASREDGYRINAAAGMYEYLNSLGLISDDEAVTKMNAIHDTAPSEVDADKHAAQAYKLIKLSK